MLYYNECAKSSEPLKLYLRMSKWPSSLTYFHWRLRLGEQEFEPRLDDTVRPFWNKNWKGNLNANWHRYFPRLHLLRFSRGPERSKSKWQKPGTSLGALGCRSSLFSFLCLRESWDKPPTSHVTPSETKAQTFSPLGSISLSQPGSGEEQELNVPGMSMLISPHHLRTTHRGRKQLWTISSQLWAAEE